VAQYATPEQADCAKDALGGAEFPAHSGQFLLLAYATLERLGLARAQQSSTWDRGDGGCADVAAHALSQSMAALGGHAGGFSDRLPLRPVHVNASSASLQHAAPSSACRGS